MVRSIAGWATGCVMNWPDMCSAAPKALEKANAELEAEMQDTIGESPKRTSRLRSMFQHQGPGRGL